MRRLLIVASLLLLVMACRSSREPNYTKHIEAIDDHSFMVVLDSARGLSEENFRMALLREAARDVIERGGIWLRVDTMEVGRHTVVERARDTTVRVEGSSPEPGERYPYDPAVPNSSQYVSGVSVARERSGEISVTFGPTDLAGANVFEASKLLDRLSRKELPSLELQ